MRQGVHEEKQAERISEEIAKVTKVADGPSAPGAQEWKSERILRKDARDLE